MFQNLRIKKYLPCFQTVIYCIFLIPLFPAITIADFIFESESVFVEVKIPDTVSVRGVYNFVNSSGKTLFQTILYPFPVDSITDFPFRISVQRKGSEGTITFSRAEKSILFPVQIDSGKTATYYISYSQKVHETRGCYILTTTQSWGKPLQFSELRLSIPEESIFKYISYVSDSVKLINKKIEYRISFKNFMPVKDLLFSW